LELQEFLSAVVPSGVLVVARKVDRQNENGQAYSTFSHTVCKLHSDMARNVQSLAAGREDVYFALASYQQGFHKRIVGGKEKKVLRVRENVALVKALWLDIDFKGEYPDAKAATLALRAFSQASALPAPAILVGSGNGLHAYWPLDAAVPLDRWQRLADALKGAAIATGFARPAVKPAKPSIDLSCSIDACRVLRPPGTFNWKDPANPKEVKLLYTSGKLYSYDALEAALTPWMGGVRRSASAVLTANPDINDDLTGGVGRGAVALEPGSFEAIIRQCGVARHVAETHGLRRRANVGSRGERRLRALRRGEDGP
jgi:uncharacterized protein (UPF0254 family)